MKFVIMLTLIMVSSPAFARTNHDAMLKSYVEARLFNRTSNGSPAASAQEMINKIAHTEMTIDLKSLRCMGYAAPDSTGKSIGVCLVSAGDKPSGGDHLKENYAILISVDIEHSDTSRIWEVVLQQSVYF